MRYNSSNAYGKYNSQPIRVIVRYICKVILALTPFTSAYSVSYEVDTKASYSHIITDKSGFFKALGHRHLISFKPVVGQVCHLPSSASFATLEFVPSAFLVDDVKTLKNYPEIANQNITDSDRQGTRQNMLSKGLLYAKKYPTIDVNINLIAIDKEEARLQIQWHALGKPVTIEVPATLTIEAQKLTVSAEFQRSAPQLGFPVFSALGGLLNVGESLQFKVYIEAIEKQSPNASCE